MLVTAVALLAGCGGTTDPEPVAKTAPATTKTTAPSAPQATVQDFTSVVAEHHADWNAQVAKTEGYCLDPREIPLCNIGYVTLGNKAEVIRLALSALHKPSAPVYKGVPPEQIKALLTETETAAGAVRLATKALSDAKCEDPMAPECIPEYIAVGMALDELSRKLDAWSVY